MHGLLWDARHAVRILVATPGFTLSLTVLASYIPAERAASIDPIGALRAE